MNLGPKLQLRNNETWFETKCTPYFQLMKYLHLITKNTKTRALATAPLQVITSWQGYFGGSLPPFFLETLIFQNTQKTVQSIRSFGSCRQNDLIQVKVYIKQVISTACATDIACCYARLAASAQWIPEGRYTGPAANNWATYLNGSWPRAI